MRKITTMFLILVAVLLFSGCGQTQKEYAAEYNNAFSITRSKIKTLKDSFDSIVDKGENDRQTDISANKFVKEKILPELSGELTKYKGMKVNDSINKLHAQSIRYIETVIVFFNETSKAIDNDENVETATPRLIKFHAHSNMALHAYKNEYSIITTGSGVSLLTLEKFEAIKPGMSYAKVVNLLGMIGVEKSQNEIGNSYTGKINSVRYDWKDDFGPGFITCIFQNGKLASKSQTNLR